MGRDTVSGLMVANDFVVISETKREGATIQQEWRATADVKRCALLARYENQRNHLEFKRKWDDEVLPIVNQYTYLSMKISENCYWDSHVNKVVEKGVRQR